MINLISDTGIQFYDFDFEIDIDAEVLDREVLFWETKEKDGQGNYKVSLDFAWYIDDDKYAKESQLRYEGLINEKEELSDKINTNVLEIRAEDQVYSFYDIQEIFEIFENKWIPLPYFQSNLAGAFEEFPTNWARVRIVKKGRHAQKFQYKAIIIFDTNLKTKMDEGPSIRGRGFQEYELCNSLVKIKNFCSPNNEYNWLDKYLKSIENNWKVKEDLIVGDQEENRKFDYISRYIYFIKYLSELKSFPSVKLHKFDLKNAIDVDLVLDIGNSRTNGILIESPEDNNSPFDFTKVKKLNLRNLTDFENKYSEPFSMRLAFQKADFGEIGHNSLQFTWPSFVRLGEEAQKLIYLETESSEDGEESMSYHSSPKRYLWDTEKSKVQWKLVNIDKDRYLNTDISIKGIGEQFKEDGSLALNLDYGAASRYSRKSLMTFVFIEILAHAISQINSVKFREAHGSFAKGRKLRRVVVTCPTAMTQVEQINLRQCAKDATIAIHRFFNRNYDKVFDESNSLGLIEIIPSVSDCKKDLSQSRNKNDWNYDEATCCQLVFMYAEIAQRYNNKCGKFFNLYGKVRKDIYQEEENIKKSITIGSIDIGGGTTDLMISAYKYMSENTAAIEPIPLYWESLILQEMTY